MKTGFLSLHSHGDRSFLDDNGLAHLSGRLRRRGHANELVLAALDGVDTPRFAALVAALRGFDVIVYQRTWSRAIPAALIAALPEAVVIHLRGEHVLDDPPGHHVCEPRGLDALLDQLAGRPPSLGARPDDSFGPNLAPIVVNADGLPAHRVFSIDGNAGCPYQADARANPLYAGIAIPDGVGRGCAFCTTGNHYQQRSQADAITAVFNQLAYVRREAPQLDRLVLRDQNPFGYLGELLARCADEGVGDFTLLLQTRADWLLQGSRRFGLALEVAARARITVSPFLVGIESFAQPELDRFNKGVTVATNVELIAALRAWDVHPAFDLAQASLGYILFTPWTTMADLRASYDGIARTRLDQLRGKLLHARVRLYPDTALYYLAQRDGLLADGAAPTALAGRYGYFPDRAWRFRDDEVARFAALAAEASDATGGRDELRLFACLLDGFAAGTPSLATVLARFARPPQPASPPRSSPAPIAARTLVRVRRTVELDLGHGCRADCALCAPAGTANDLDAALRGGAARVVFRNAPVEVAPMVARARALGAAEIVVAGHLSEIRTAEDARSLGVDAVLVPIASHVAAVHDRAAGVPGSLVATLVAMRALAAAGVAVELEVPILAARLQDLPALLDLARRAVPELRAVRFMLPRHAMPAVLAPPPLDELGRRLDAALIHADRLGLPAPLDVTAAIPICAAQDRARAALRFDPKKPTRLGGCHKVGPCLACAVAPQCAGLATSYLRAHGTRQVRALDDKPAALYAQRTTPRRVWDEGARAAARQVSLLVLRPTVHCNQDCAFCSANESTPNVWADPARMMREIARAARRGLDRVSFSGGEPTLARELPAYVAVARRAGLRKIELVTNGVLLDREARVAELVDAGLTHAFVSLHGHDEAVSSAITRKVGDFARTAAAIGHLERAGVVTVINHVVNAGNYRFLTRFVEEVHARYGGRVMISFAFVTPQYKALENFALVPRLSDVMPHLHAAAWRALGLGQPFVVGSRQGVPPCFLGPFAAWSDLMQLAHEARAEDAPQKQQGPQCATCRYARWCTGLWKPYIARFGTDELVPVAGPLLGDAERAAILVHARRPPWGQPTRFDEVPPLLRAPALEAMGPRRLDEDAARRGQDQEARAPSRLAGRSRPLRLLMIGSGRRARQLARGALVSGGFAFTGVCSPHAAEADRTAFEGCSPFAELDEALERTRPDAVVIASATSSHVELAARCIAAGVAILVEKPLATSEAEAARVVELAAARGVLLVPAHNDRFQPELARFFAAAQGRPLTITRRSPADAPEVPALWSRPALYESLYHLLVLAHAHAADSLVAPRVAFTGEARLERLRVELGPVTLAWELGGTADALVLDAAPVHWRRVDRTVAYGDEPPVRRGSDVEAMFVAFHTALRDGTPPPVAATDGVAVMRATRLVVDALEAAGAPFTRATTPRHAASRELSRRYR